MLEPIHILLVEDSPSDAEIVAESLREAGVGRYDLIHAATLGGGVERLDANAPVDVILTDLWLPDSEGLDTVRRIRDAAGDTPIVVLTGTSPGNEDLGLACIEAGATDYLRKNEIRPILLRRALTFALERQRQREVRELRSALDRYRRRLAGELAALGVEVTRRGGEELDRAYDILLKAYLAHLGDHAPKPTADIENLANDLSQLGAGARDLIDLHVRALERAVRGVGGDDARARAADARLLALEMMAALLEIYRGVARYSE